MLTEETEYKGSPVLIIRQHENDKHPIQFSLSKARFILETFDEIKKFVSKHESLEKPSYTAASNQNVESTAVPNAISNESIMPGYNENWIFFDFSNSYAFKKTIPVYCSIDGQELYAPTWAKMFAAIIENELQKDNAALNSLYESPLPPMNGRNFFLTAPIPGFTCPKLSNGFYVNLNHDLPRMMELIKAFCLYCGYQPEQIKLYGIPKGVILSSANPVIKSDSPAKKTFTVESVSYGNSNVIQPSKIYTVDFSNLGNFAYTKPFRATYNGKYIDCNKSWRSLFINAIKKLYETHQDKFREDINENAYREWYSKSGILHPDDTKLLEPVKLCFDIYIESHYSATDLVNQIRRFLDLCGESYSSLHIEYYFPKDNMANASVMPQTAVKYPDELISAAKSVIQQVFSNGMKLNSNIAQNKFKNAYEQITGKPIDAAIDIDSLALQAGIEAGGKIYIITYEAKQAVKELTEKAFHNGNRVISFAEFYVQNSNLFQQHNINTETAIKNIMLELFPDMKYATGYFSPSEDNCLEQDIIKCFGENIMLSLHEIKQSLPYTAAELIKKELQNNDSFVFAGINSCILASAIDIDAYDVSITEKQIEHDIAWNGHSSMESIYCKNTENKNPGIPTDALKEAIFQKHFKNSYAKRKSLLYKKKGN